MNVSLYQRGASKAIALLLASAFAGAIVAGPVVQPLTHIDPYFGCAAEANSCSSQDGWINTGLDEEVLCCEQLTSEDWYEVTIKVQIFRKSPEVDPCAECYRLLDLDWEEQRCLPISVAMVPIDPNANCGCKL